MIKLGKLKEINIREVWPHEQFDFSKWLAKEENIQELGDTLNLSFTDVETEKFVGSYRCDILCKDELTGKNVIIENQLESTNHDHLGKIITYASGLDADVIIWIVAQARQEHASAIEWLNKHTDDNTAFFLLEIHAYTIGDSEPAPMFKIIEHPNDFEKSVKAVVRKGNMSETQTKRFEFWTAFNEHIIEKGKPFNTHKPSTDHWYSVAIGSSRCYILIELVNKDHFIRVGLWIPDDKGLYDTLHEKKEEIEKALPFPLNWERLDNKKGSSVSTRIKGLNFKKKENYKELMDQIIDYVVSMRSVFKPYS